METAESTLAVVSTIRARDAALDCPNCGKEIDGWVRDPRGLEDTCDSCKKPYRISATAEVKIR